jgi:polyribonucleotide nucleotidyltransferase
MFDIYRKEIELAGRPLIIETGKIARQADGAVQVTYGESSVLCAATADKEPSDLPFFPLTVHYEEKTYAAGKIPGGFFKREGKPSEHATLTSRLIDRPIRPLFADRYHHDTQILCTVLAHDLENEPDIPAMIGASAALTLSGLPFLGPIAASRVGRIDDEFVLNPTNDQLEESDLNLVVAGTRDGVLMVESEANELDEETMLEAVMFGWRGFQPVIDAIIELAEMCAKQPWTLPEPSVDEEKLSKQIAKLVEKDLKKAYSITDKQERREKIDAAKQKAVDELTDAEDENAPDADTVKDLVKDLESQIVRRDVIENKTRIDGRALTDVRDIHCDVELLPRAHGSALFTRGETQALVMTTLGTGDDEQIIDALAGEYRDNFLLHYNFPPYSVGETGRISGPGRREIGHGHLAKRALQAVMPTDEDFPYTVRVVSEITESNGSSSMATVCGASLSMMDAGVPLKKPVAGIAMGLIKDEEDFAVLTDILGDEDHLGDMDFKVAGTADGVTSLQMDIKITSVTEEIMKQALEQSREGRLHILNEMSQALTSARSEVKETAPQMKTIQIPEDKIREVIGTGGKVIREIVEETGAKVDIEDDGTVKVSAVNDEAAQAAIDWIKGIVAEPEEGEVYTGKVVKVVDFGCFVNFLGSKDGLVHISELADYHVDKVTDLVEEGDEIPVKVLGFDNRGRVKLSMRAVSDEEWEETGLEKINTTDKEAA